jgi:hypothetical protein
LKQVTPYLPLNVEGNKAALRPSYRYLIELGIKQETIAKHPQLLIVPSDAFAKGYEKEDKSIVGLRKISEDLKNV